LKDVLLNVIHVVIFFFNGIICTAGAKFIKNDSMEQLTGIRDHLEKHLK